MKRSFFYLITFLLASGSTELFGQNLTLDVGAYSGSPDDTISVQITATNFTNISGYQGTVRWDSALIDFVEFFNPTTGLNNIVGNPGQGLIPLDAATFSWIDFSGGSQTFADGTPILGVRFVIKSNAPAGITPVTLDGSVTQLLYSDGGNLNIPTVNQGTITVIGCIPTADPGFLFQSSACANGFNPQALITGDLGGTFAVDNGASINSVTGVLDLSSTVPGTTYFVTYTVGAGCPAVSGVSVLILAPDDASFTIADTLCLGDADPVPTITGDIGGTFSVNNGAIIDPVSGMLDLSSTVAGTNYQITYATNDTCPNTFSQMVHIQTSDDASFTMVDSVCVFDFNPLPSIQGTTGGTFSVDQGASISAQSGELFLATTSIGTTYTVQYITGGNCPDTATQTITVTGIADASFSYPDTLCPSGTALPTITGQTGGSFTITGGATINATTGEIDLSTISGSFATVTYALPDPCLSFSQFSILVLDDQAPDSVSLADAVGECEVILNAPTTMDNCAGMITATTTDSLVYDQPGTYTVNWTFDDGNGNQTTASQNVVVQDDTPPTVICRDLTVRVDGNGQAVITVAQIDSATTDNCMLMSLTISQDTFTLADFGQNTVSLIATDGNGNVDSCEATVTVLGTTGIWDQLQPISFDVYPNPAQDIVHVNWESQEFGEVKLRVFNQMGQEVYQANHYKVSDQLKASIDLSLLPTGMYFVQVRHGEKVGRQQLVKR